MDFSPRENIQRIRQFTYELAAGAVSGKLDDLSSFLEQPCLFLGG